VDKVIACAQAGAQAVGCHLEYQVTPGYQEIIPNRILAGLFKSNLESLGRMVVDPDPNERMGSTDMGDVSHLVPSIHPYLAIAPQTVAGHTLEFKQYCISDAGKSAMLDAAKAIAMTTVDLLTNPDLFQQNRYLRPDYNKQSILPFMRVFILRSLSSKSLDGENIIRNLTLVRLAARLSWKLLIFIIFITTIVFRYIFSGRYIGLVVSPLLDSPCW
jgi:hypothetical protein